MTHAERRQRRKQIAEPASEDVMTRTNRLREIAYAVTLAEQTLLGAIKDTQALALECQPDGEQGLAYRLLAVLGNLRCAATATGASLEPVRAEVEAVEKVGENVPFGGES